jgi:branched-subunit amino acid ABC-type transport system permease component
MNRSVRTIIYCLLAVVMAITFYFIFNAGSPDAIYRPLLPNPAHDTLITLILAMIVGGLSLLLFANRENDPIKLMLESNAGYIRKLRREGMTEGEIADSFLKKLKAPGGFMYGMARRKVLKFLARIQD